jgi:hypothetical protein
VVVAVLHVPPAVIAPDRGHGCGHGDPRDEPPSGAAAADEAADEQTGDQHERDELSHDFSSGLWDRGKSNSGANP